MGVPIFIRESPFIWGWGYLISYQYRDEVPKTVVIGLVKAGGK